MPPRSNCKSMKGGMTGVETVIVIFIVTKVILWLVKYAYAKHKAKKREEAEKRQSSGEPKALLPSDEFFKELETTNQSVEELYNSYSIESQPLLEGIACRSYVLDGNSMDKISKLTDEQVKDQMEDFVTSVMVTSLGCACIGSIPEPYEIIEIILTGIKAGCSSRKQNKYCNSEMVKASVVTIDSITQMISIDYLASMAIDAIPFLIKAVTREFVKQWNKRVQRYKIVGDDVGDIGEISTKKLKQATKDGGVQTIKARYPCFIQTCANAYNKLKLKKAPAEQQQLGGKPPKSKHTKTYTKTYTKTDIVYKGKDGKRRVVYEKDGNHYIKKRNKNGDIRHYRVKVSSLH